MGMFHPPRLKKKTNNNNTEPTIMGQLIKKFFKKCDSCSFSLLLISSLFSLFGIFVWHSPFIAIAFMLLTLFFVYIIMSGTFGD